MIRVSNAGPQAASNVTLTDPLPAATLFLSCSSSQGSCSGPPIGFNGTVSAALGFLNPGSFATVTITVRVTAAAGRLTNTATVASSTPDPDPGNNSDTKDVLVGSGSGGAPIPVLSPGMLGLLWAALAIAGLWTLRRS